MRLMVSILWFVCITANSSKADILLNGTPISINFDSVGGTPITGLSVWTGATSSAFGDPNEYKHDSGILGSNKGSSQTIRAPTYRIIQA